MVTHLKQRKTIKDKPSVLKSFLFLTPVTFVYVGNTFFDLYPQKEAGES